LSGHKTCCNSIEDIYTVFKRKKALAMIKIEKVMNGRSKETNFLFDIIQPEGRITLLFVQLDALSPVKGAIS